MGRIPLWLLNIGLRATVRTSLSLVKTPAAMRRTFERRTAAMFRLPAGVGTRETEIRGSGDRRIPALWCEGDRATGERVLLYLHGGGYIAGSPRTHRHLAARLAQAAGARAFLPDYALAPERPFPAALEDALAAYRHLLDEGHPADRIALAGDSAGGGLAAALLLAAAREGLPRPSSAVLFSPWADMTMKAKSLRRNATRDCMLPVRRMAEVVQLTLAGHPADDPLASPALGRFDRPPPVLLFASRAEILLDDAVALAEALRDGGGDVQLEIWRRVPHAWPVFVTRNREADRAVDMAARFLARRLGTAEPEAAGTA